MAVIPGGVVRGAALAGAVAGAGLAFAPGYVEAGLVRMLLALTAAGAVAVTALLARRMAAVQAVLGGLTVPLTALIVVAAWRPGETPGAVPGALDALLHSGARILTTTPPVPVTVDTLALPLAGVWLTGVAGGLALRSGRPLLALLPPVLLLAGAVVLAGPSGSPAYGAVAVLVASGAVLLGVMPGAEFSAPGPRALLGSGGVAAALALVALVVGPPVLAGWSATPPDPRTAAQPPTGRDEAVNPLSYLPAWAARPYRPLLEVRAGHPVELRWVTLSDFTGHTWLPETGYQPTGGRLPPPDPAPPRTTPQRASLRIDDLPGPWLPAVGHPRTVTGLPVAYDPATGTLTPREGRIAGRSYTVTGDVPAWRPEDAAGAPVPTDPAFQRYRELPPGAPARIRDVAAVVAGADSPYRQAVRLAEHLRRDYVVDVRARGGHGYASLAAFLVMPGEGRRGAGTPDQFASAFAVMARAAGLPSRVVVGFGPGGNEGGQSYTVRTGDAVAWGEVYFDRVGWVPFDVIPGSRTATGSAAAPQGSVPTPQPAPATARQPGAAPTSPPPTTPPPEPSADGVSVPWAWLTAFAGVVVGVSPPVVVVVLRRRRSRHHLYGGTPAERVLGAWSEAVDGLRLAGRAVPAACTAREVAARYPDEGLERLATRVTAVGFWPSGTVDPEEARAASTFVHGYVRTLRRSLPLPRRLLWWLDPRPLFW
ncbi:MAG TPA: transglutaminaseTgpA domain-containing protein [Thermomonospora sp.]|nr:transglutaminaseTgpA domain-containing protein [Thermomonospora sp.]